MAAYSLSIVGVLVLCLLSISLAIYSGSSKGRAGALSGPVLPADDDNLLYRIDRVHMNAVEALPPFVVPAVLAMTVGGRTRYACDAGVGLYRNSSDPPCGLFARRQSSQRRQHQNNSLCFRGARDNHSHCRDRRRNYALTRLTPRHHDGNSVACLALRQPLAILRFVPLLRDERTSGAPNSAPDFWVRALLGFGRALRAGVADRVQDVPDCCCGLPGEAPAGGSRRATKARSRACGSAGSCIQPCSSHSRMAPASCSTEIAHPRNVRIAGRRSFITASKSLLRYDSL